MRSKDEEDNGNKAGKRRTIAKRLGTEYRRWNIRRRARGKGKNKRDDENSGRKVQKREKNNSKTTENMM